MIFSDLIITFAHTKKMTAPSQTQVYFARTVIARLAVWPVLRIAVDSSWGGPESKQKRSWMASELLDVFESSSPSSTLNPKSASNQVDEDYIEEMILQMMNDEFDCVVEDGSSTEVAADLVAFWREKGAKSGGEKAIEQRMKFWEEKEMAIQGKQIQAQEVKVDEEEWEEDDGESGDEDGSDNAMEVDEPPALIDRRNEGGPVIDEDGFTLVKGKARRHG